MAKYINKEQYYKEFAQELSMRIGIKNNSMLSSFLLEKLQKNLSDQENTLDTMSNLRNVNNYIHNMNSLMDGFNKQIELDKNPKNQDNNNKMLQDAKVIKEDFNKRMNKFKNEFKQLQENKKTQEAKVRDDYRDKLKEIDKRLYKIDNSNDKRVTRWKDRLLEDREKIVNEKEDKFSKIQNNFTSKVDEKFKGLNSQFVENIDTNYGVDISKSNNELNLNLTTKRIRVYDINYVSEAYYKELHKANPLQLQKECIDVLEHPTTIARIKEFAKSEMNKAYEKNDFNETPKNLIKEIKSFSKKVITNGLPQNYINQMDPEVKKAMDDKINKIIKNATNEFESTKVNIIEYKQLKQENKQLIKSQAKFENETNTINEVKTSFTREVFLENDNNKKLEIINLYINKINDLKISKDSKDSLNKDFKDFKNMLVPEVNQGPKKEVKQVIKTTQEIKKENKIKEDEKLIKNIDNDIKKLSNDFMEDIFKDEKNPLKDMKISKDLEKIEEPKVKNLIEKTKEEVKSKRDKNKDENNNDEVEGNEDGFGDR